MNLKRFTSFALALILCFALAPVNADALASENDAVKNGYYDSSGQWVEGKLQQTLPEGIHSVILTQIDFPVYILWDIFLDNVTTSLPFIMTPVAVNMDKTKRWLERQVMPSLLMIKEIEKQTGANYLEEIDRHTRLTEKQELKIKQMTTDIADMIEKDTAVPQGNDGIF